MPTIRINSKVAYLRNIEDAKELPHSKRFSFRQEKSPSQEVERFSDFSPPDFRQIIDPWITDPPSRFHECVTYSISQHFVN